MTRSYSAKFPVGQVINHKKFGYRGVILDVDPVYSGSDEWYDKVARSRPPKYKPWYHVLVEDSNQQTYVAERHLEPDESGEPVNHPLIDIYFEGFENSVYIQKKNLN